MSLVAATLAWMAEYSELLEEGTARLATGESLTEEFADRCQELDVRLRRLGGDALRAAADAPGGAQAVARLRSARRDFGEATVAGIEGLRQRRAEVAASRRGLKGYGATGQWLSGGTGRFIERTA